MPTRLPIFRFDGELGSIGAAAFLSNRTQFVRFTRYPTA